MADETPEIGAADLRAAVASGLMTEAQAASLRALAQDRAGKRALMPKEDEPFEFFRGFSEIFVSVGLVILLAGIAALLSWMGGLTVLIVLPAICAAIAWWWATYFTLRRRMNLPSMVLALAFGSGVYTSALTLLSGDSLPDRMALVGASLFAALGMALWYRRFRLPFAAFVIGLFGLSAIYGLTADVTAATSTFFGGGPSVLFDLGNSGGFATATLVFGILAFAAGLWFDTRDPHRLGRHAATGFWLHLLAAPALVNTVALTLYNMGGSTGMLATALAMLLIALLALVIDRRSFLTAGIIYIALLLGWALQGDTGASFGSTVAMLLILGAFVTAIGTWWVDLRRTLMRFLPSFPGKSRLPPYAEAP